MFKLISLVSGTLFGIGMAVSGMVDPAKVIAFLDIAGDWDPSLAFVMGGALLVFLPCYLLVIKPRSKPIAAEKFCLSENTKVDKALLAGAGLFGLGWGLVGICPGPVVSSLGAGNIQSWLFLASMLLGLVAGQRISRRL